MLSESRLHLRLMGRERMSFSRSQTVLESDFLAAPLENNLTDWSMSIQISHGMHLHAHRLQSAGRGVEILKIHTFVGGVPLERCVVLSPPNTLSATHWSAASVGRRMNWQKHRNEKRPSVSKWLQQWQKKTHSWNGMLQPLECALAYSVSTDCELALCHIFEIERAALQELKIQSKQKNP